MSTKQTNIDLFNYSRRSTVDVNVGGVSIGCSRPIRVQSMTNTSTMDTEEKARLHSGYSVCKVAKKMFDSGNTVNDKELSPSYLRLSQAERERNEKLNSGVKF